MSKLSLEEIRIGAKDIHDTYYKNGYTAAREKADAFQAVMLTHDNTDFDSRYEFEKHSGMTYRE